MSQELKEEAWSHLKDTQFVMFATKEDDQPRVRPITLIHFEDRLWVTTTTQSAKIKQIKSNPKVEFCWLEQREGDQDIYLRVAGNAVIIDDMDSKKKIAEFVDFFSYYFKSVDDPNYTLIEIVPEEVEYLQAGNYPAKKFKL